MEAYTYNSDGVYTCTFSFETLIGMTDNHKNRQI